MSQKIKNKVENSKDAALKKDLLEQFSLPIEIKQNNHSKKNSINPLKETIQVNVENTIDKIVLQTISSEFSLKEKNDIQELSNTMKNFLKRSNFGEFGYDKRCGSSIFKVRHSSGKNGNQFLEKLFEVIFKKYLDNFMFEIISKDNYVCIIFR